MRDALIFDTRAGRQAAEAAGPFDQVLLDYASVCADTVRGHEFRTVTVHWRVNLNPMQKDELAMRIRHPEGRLIEGDPDAWAAALLGLTRPRVPPRQDDLARGRLQGIACALAALAATHHSDSVVLTDILDDLGLSLDALKAAGAEPEDLAALRKGLRE